MKKITNWFGEEKIKPIVFAGCSNVVGIQAIESARLPQYLGRGSKRIWFEI